MTIKEMQDNIIGKYGYESKETVLFFKMCEKLKEDNAVNNAILTVCHNSLLGIVDTKRIEETKIREKAEKEELMKKAVEKMVADELDNI